jgi:hypothetical protein
MADNINSSSFSDSSQTIEKAAERGGAALKQGMNAARDGLDSAKEGLEYAQEHLNDGVDYVLGAIRSLNDMVTRQPILAVGGAFLVGYIVARLMRRGASS